MTSPFYEFLKDNTPAKVIGTLRLNYPEKHDFNNPPIANGQRIKTHFNIDTLTLEDRHRLIELVRTGAGEPLPALVDRSAQSRTFCRLAVAHNYAATVGVCEELFGDSFDRRAVLMEDGSLLFPFSLISKGLRAVLKAASVPVLEQWRLPYTFPFADRNDDDRSRINVLINGDDEHIQVADERNPLLVLQQTWPDVDPYFLLPTIKQLHLARFEGRHCRLLERSHLAAAIDTNVTYRMDGDGHLFLGGKQVKGATENELVWIDRVTGELGRWVYCNRDSRYPNRAVLEFRGGRFIELTTSDMVRPVTASDGPNAAGLFDVMPDAATAPSNAVNLYFTQQPQVAFIDGYYRADGQPLAVLEPPPLPTPGSIYCHEAGSIFRTLVIEGMEDAAYPFVVFLTSTFFRIIPRRPMAPATLDAPVHLPDATVTQYVVEARYWPFLREAARVYSRRSDNVQIKVTDRFPYRAETARYPLGYSHHRPRIAPAHSHVAVSYLSRTFATFVGPDEAPIEERRPLHTSWPRRLIEEKLKEVLGRQDIVVRKQHSSGEQYFYTPFFTLFRYSSLSRSAILYRTNEHGFIDGRVERFSLMDRTVRERYYLDMMREYPPFPLPVYTRTPAEQLIGASGVMHLERGGHVRAILANTRRDELREAMKDLPISIDWLDEITGKRFPTVLPRYGVDEVALRPNASPPYDGFRTHLYILRGKCGAGKSTAIQRLAQDILVAPNYSIMVYISARRALVQQEYEKIRGGDRVVHYSDRRELRKGHTRIIYTTIHSLHKFVGPASFFDEGAWEPIAAPGQPRLPWRRQVPVTVVWDEYCTALFTDYANRSVLDAPNMEKALGFLLTLFASDIYLLDALDAPIVVAGVVKRITNTALRGFLTTQRLHLAIHPFKATHNLVTEQERQATLFCSPRSMADLLTTIAYDYLDEHLCVAAFFGSRKELEEAIAALEELLPDLQGHVMKFTAAERPGNVADLARQIEEDDIRLFAFTTAAGVGVDIAASNEWDSLIEQFSAVALFGASARHLSTMDIYQASSRVRCAKRLFLALDRAPLTPFELASDVGWQRLMRPTTLEPFLEEQQANLDHVQAITELSDYAPGAANAVLQRFATRLEVPLPPDNGVYAETLVYSRVIAGGQPYQNSLVAALFASEGYRVTVKWGTTCSDEEVKDMEDLKERHELHRYARLQVDPELPDVTRRRAEQARKDLRLSRLAVLPHRPLQFAEERLSHNVDRLRRALPALHAYHYLALQRPVELAQWQAAIRLIYRNTTSSRDLVREMQATTERSNGVMGHSDALVMRSNSMEMGVAFDGVALYIASQLAGMRDAGFFLPTHPVNHGARETDRFPSLASLKNRGHIELVEAAVAEDFIDREMRRGAYWNPGRKNLQGTQASRHIQRLMMSLFNSRFGSHRGKIRASRSDDLSIFFGFYFDFALDRFHEANANARPYLVSVEQIEEARQDYDGYLEAVAQYTGKDVDAVMAEVMPGDSQSIRKAKRARH